MTFTRGNLRLMAKEILDETCTFKKMPSFEDAVAFDDLRYEIKTLMPMTIRDEDLRKTARQIMLKCESAGCPQEKEGVEDDELADIWANLTHARWATAEAAQQAGGAEDVMSVDDEVEGVEQNTQLP